MNQIKWTKELSVGIDKIDQQHMKLIAIINKVQSMFESNKSKNQLEEVLNELVEFARIHFTTEEEYFIKWNYPYTEEHKAEHGRLILKVLQFKDKFDKTGVKIIPDLLNFLKDWLENHLKKHDFKYANYFKDKDFI